MRAANRVYRNAHRGYLGVCGTSAALWFRRSTAKDLDVTTSPKSIDLSALELVTGGRSFSDGTTVDSVQAGWNTKAIQIIDTKNKLVCYGLANETTGGGAGSLSCAPLTPTEPK